MCLILHSSAFTNGRLANYSVRSIGLHYFRLLATHFRVCPMNKYAVWQFGRRRLSMGASHRLVVSITACRKLLPA